jgi:hypothetical protein
MNWLKQNRDITNGEYYFIHFVLLFTNIIITITRGV